MRTVTAAVAITLGVLAPACGSSQKNAATAEQARLVHQAPAGTQVNARLNTAIGTSESSVGQPFTATIVSPIMNVQGQAIIPAGALVSGRVVGVDQGPAASVQLLFTSIDGGQGPAPFSATLRSPSGAQARYSSEEIYAQSLPYNAVLVPPKRPNISGTPGRAPNAIGGGPFPQQQQPQEQQQQAQGQAAQPQTGVNLPVGTEVKLVLTKPLEYPPPATDQGQKKNDNGGSAR
jgi:hypothetical protein